MEIQKLQPTGPSIERHPTSAPCLREFEGEEEVAGASLTTASGFTAQPPHSLAPRGALMKAIRLHARGGPESLRFEDAPAPRPGPGEVLVRVRAAARVSGLGPTTPDEG